MILHRPSTTKPASDLVDADSRALHLRSLQVSHQAEQRSAGPRIDNQMRRSERALDIGFSAYNAESAELFNDFRARWWPGG